MPSRLHYTLATGAITSKSGAGQYALGTFDSCWQPIIQEALGTRRGGYGRAAYRTHLGRHRDALAFLSMVADDAQRLVGHKARQQSPAPD
jgi:hypothetical protein